MAGIAMITIEASIVAIVMLSVVLDSATHLYRPPGAGLAVCTGPSARSSCTLTEPTPIYLLDRN